MKRDKICRLVAKGFPLLGLVQACHQSSLGRIADHSRVRWPFRVINQEQSLVVGPWLLGFSYVLMGYSMLTGQLYQLLPLIVAVGSTSRIFWPLYGTFCNISVPAKYIIEQTTKRGQITQGKDPSIPAMRPQCEQLERNQIQWNHSLQIKQSATVCVPKPTSTEQLHRPFGIWMSVCGMHQG